MFRALTFGTLTELLLIGLSRPKPLGNVCYGLAAIVLEPAYRVQAVPGKER